MTDQEKIIDKLMDWPNVSEEAVFQELVSANSNALFKLSPYELSKMWNSSMPVSLGVIKPRTANKFGKCEGLDMARRRKDYTGFAYAGSLKKCDGCAAMKDCALKSDPLAGSLNACKMLRQH